MPRMEKDVIEAVLSKVLARAREKEENDAYNGGWGGQARSAESEVSIYRAGMAGVIPTQWAWALADAKKEIDPEWPEYERLRKKFGD